jgi:hypothetical protein
VPPKVRTLAGNGTVENELARLAALSHGVVTRAQLLSVGITPDEIKHRLGTGSLLREHRGVYRVGHRAPNREARYMAAVRAAGSRAVLSGLAAAHLLDLIKGRPPKPEVTAPTERRIDGVRTRRARDLSRSERTIWRGIPVTSPERTIVDLAGALDLDALARLVHEAEVRFGTGPEAVERVLNRRPRSAGAGVLRRVLFGDAHVTLSALERRFLDLLRDAGLPLPITNRRAGTTTWTVAGPIAGSRWSSTAIGTTARGMPSSRTAGGNATRAPAETSSSASRGETSPSDLRRLSPSCMGSSA